MDSSETSGCVKNDKQVVPKSAHALGIPPTQINQGHNELHE